MTDGKIDRSEELTALIADRKHNERQCADFLPEIAEHLCEETPFRILRHGKEEPSRFGSTDYVVSAEISHGGHSKSVAYVWELKAPQIYLYELDDSVRRFRPTPELIKAETQLLHYVADLQDSNSSKTQYKLRPNGAVKAAGIIIGSKHRIARVPRQRPDDISLDQIADARLSHEIREQFLYRPAGIRVKTWDWVVEKLRPPSIRMPDLFG